MKITFCLFKYFPYGGLQRDMLAIARALAARGHHLTLLTGEWQGERPDGLTVNVLPVKGFSNHRRNLCFFNAVADFLKQQPADLVVGFNKMPGLDIYYAADTCFKAKVIEERSWLYGLMPRAKHFLAFENAVFSKQSSTQLLMISQRETDIFKNYYQTPDERFVLLPPGIQRDRCAPSDYVQRRAAMREQLGLSSSNKLLLMVGSGFKTKGLDRAIEALAALPAGLQKTTQFMVIGKDHAAVFQRQAKRLGVDDRVHFLGAKDNVPEYLWAADLLLHPAYRENTGTILLESAVAGLPVVTTDVCGYAHYLTDYDMGVVLSTPFDQSEFNRNVQMMLESKDALHWHKNGIAFGRQQRVYDMPAVAAESIEQIGQQRCEIVPH